MMSFLQKYRVLEIEGWMEEDELEWLYKAGCHARTAIEVGCFMGRSTAAILAGQRDSYQYPPVEFPAPILFAFDTFDGGGTVREEEVAGRGRGWLQRIFTNNMFDRGLLGFHSVDVTTMKNREFYISRGEADMLFIDARHDYNSVRADIKNWSPLVRPGGIISGHDYHESWPGVIKAVNGAFGERVVENPVGGIWCVRKNVAL